MRLFETDRLIGREFTLEDLVPLARILSDPDVMKYSVRGVCSEEQTREFLSWCIGCYAEYGVGPWALVDRISGELIGFCGVSPEIVEGKQEYNLGYRLAKKYWNFGLATEAAHAAINYFFKYNDSSVVVIIEPEHTSSVRVTEKVGFKEYREIEFHSKLVRLYRKES